MMIDVKKLTTVEIESRLAMIDVTIGLLQSTLPNTTNRQERNNGNRIALEVLTLKRALEIELAQRIMTEPPVLVVIGLVMVGRVEKLEHVQARLTRTLDPITAAEAAECAGCPMRFICPDFVEGNE